MSSSNRKYGRANNEPRDRSLAHAVALQDHLSRTFQMPGPNKLPSLAPGAEPTLAQRVGLYPKPEKLLSQEAWEAIHGLARQRQDCTDSCAICMEPFKSEQQVLLSCSHVFHSQCLSSFEHHTRLRACPLCRKQWYQKHVIQDAAEAYRHLCATRIQAAVRGWLCRKHLLDLIRYAPPQAAGLKRQWAAGRLSETGRALAALVQQGEDSLEQLFSELDANLEAARQLPEPEHMRMQATGAVVPPEQDAARGLTAAGAVAAASASKKQGQAGAGSRGSRMQRGRCRGTTWGGNTRQQQQQSSSRHPAADTASDSSLNSPRNLEVFSSNGSGRGSSVSSNQRRLQAGVKAGIAAIAREELRQRLQAAEQAHADFAATTASSSGSNGQPEQDAVACNVNWEDILSRACQRGETECAICLCPLARRQQEAVALLSCSHTFHMQCVVSFEQFEQGRGGRASCPVCRSSYAKKCFAIDVQLSSNNTVAAADI